MDMVLVERAIREALYYRGMEDCIDEALDSFIFMGWLWEDIDDLYSYYRFEWEAN